MDMSNRVVTVVLAAGAGKRLADSARAAGIAAPRHPRGKALLQVGGCSLALRAVQTARAAGTCPLLVLGHRADEVSAALAIEAARRGIAPLRQDHIVTAAQWSTGLSASFRAGVQQAARLGAREVAVLLADQPGISSQALRRVLQAHMGASRTGLRASAGGPDQPPITRGVIEKTPTHPVVFEVKDALRAAEAAVGDSGARAYLRENAARVAPVDISDCAQIIDVDTVDDLRRYTGEITVAYSSELASSLAGQAS